jgi:hypothetical protein
VAPLRVQATGLVLQRGPLAPVLRLEPELRARRRRRAVRPGFQRAGLAERPPQRRTL